ncbi:5-deoxy-glucuronate isomerase [Streptomyces spirodelae]|uniref:5-deoxy-glucuronate isomerase n=1 Tax=Streptomyces spirodelae TaxID=2812904 RepID=A0ABS3WML2_9ACTN|nr:5-deoxy-glucuronate isomerase [Streptomyces spirodelae]MBO8184131.1 5-deoxy-glucuronate isomerase [Streptomyces spirodelae]
MSETSTYHLPAGTAAEGPYDLLVTPESAGWGHSGLRTLALGPGRAHTLATGDSEFLVLPLTGGCTVTVDGRTFELEGRRDVFDSVTDFVYLPPESEAVLNSASGGRFALRPSAAAPGYDLYCLNVMAGPGQDRAWLICDDPAHGWVRSTWGTQDVDARLPFGGDQDR